MASERPSSIATADPRAQNPHDNPHPQTGATPAHNQSPWWTAPSGKPVSIPAFARIFSAEALVRWLFPAPRIPVRVKARRRF